MACPIEMVKLADSGYQMQTVYDQGAADTLLEIGWSYAKELPPEEQAKLTYPPVPLAAPEGETEELETISSPTESAAGEVVVATETTAPSAPELPAEMPA